MQAIVGTQTLLDVAADFRETGLSCSEDEDKDSDSSSDTELCLRCPPDLLPPLVAGLTGFMSENMFPVPLPLFKLKKSGSSGFEVARPVMTGVRPKHHSKSVSSTAMKDEGASAQR